MSSILHLQRTIGNQAGGRLLENKDENENLGDGALTGLSLGFARDFSQIPLHPKSSPKVQPRLTVSTPDYMYLARQALQSGGEPLPGPARRQFEAHWGHDLSRVRIHADAKATSSARELGAAAYTVGRNIVFDKRFYNPSTAAGERILAHELAHAVADRMAEPAPTLRLGAASSAEESAARHAADTLSPPRTASGAADTIHRITREQALTYAQSLDTRYPNWLGVIPNCPCTFREARASSHFVYSALNDLVLSLFHPGATSSVRSSRGYQTTPGTNHGQQCCYDDFGDLITDGAAAGTPDVWSPETNFQEHQDWDVATFHALGWRVYNQYWRPNRGTRCERNAALITRRRSQSRTDPVDRTVTTQSGVAWALHANGSAYLVQIRIENSSTSPGRTGIYFRQFVDPELREDTIARARRLQPRGLQTIPWGVITGCPASPPTTAIRR
ncbi:AMOP domain protein [Thioflavicoccus mobilis 8321]|uniref:AMOP domain protein n=2 Tax=Thioflavicoccus mobilis TaxID=80679 RepID=L0GUH5_9GAMM|nr:AMOP domain protein [Thioflavicoccus mobilis 8321]